MALDLGLEREMLCADKGAHQGERTFIELRAQPLPADADAFAVPPLGELADVALFIDRGEAAEVVDFVNPVNATDLVIVVVVIAGDANACADGVFVHGWEVVASIFAE